jgi:hypothetical protein
MKILADMHADLIEAERRGRLVSALVSEERRERRRELGDILCELHNAELIDLTSDQNLLAIDALEHNEFWTVNHPLEKAIPNLECSHQDILKLVRTLVKKAGADLAAGMPNLSLAKWSKNNPDKAREIIEGVKELDEFCLAHGVFAVVGLGDEALVFDLVRHANVLVSVVGLRALGRMEALSVNGVKEGVDSALGVIERERDANVRAAAIEAAFMLWEKLGPLKPYRQQEFIGAIGKRGDSTEISILSTMLSYRNRGLPKESITRVLGLLETVTANSDSTLRNLDHAIKKNDERWDFEHVASVFATLIPHLDEQPNQRDYYTFSSWVWSDPQHASYLFARWFDCGEIHLCSFLSELLNLDAKGTAVWIRKPHLPQDAYDQIFIARKCVGFLWNHEVAAASILLSIVKNGRAEARAVAEELLFNPLLLSYGGDLRDFLETQRGSNSKRISACVKRLLSRQDEHFAGLEVADTLVELLPTNEQRRAASLKDQERNREIQKRAHEQSVLASLMTRKTLLYGRKSFFVVHGADGEKHPTISPLAEISHSTELPRLLVIDPVGFNAMISFFRFEQRRLA